MEIKMERGSGVLMHISSLPSPYGIGAFGKEAYDFVDFLKKSGQKFWQVLPLGSTSYGDSPYQSFSTFAGNPYFVDLEKLCEEDLLTKTDLKALDFGHKVGQVDYEKLYFARYKALKEAHKNLEKNPEKHKKLKMSMQAFAGKTHKWIYDYCIFMAVKEHFGNVAWLEWPDEGIKRRNSDSMDYYWNLLQKDFQFWIFIQFFFFKQWTALKDYANNSGVRIIGDIPIYVALDSVDVWANPQLFCLNENQNPTVVAGCPPDYFSLEGQLWGNPIYDWEAHRKEGYYWWFARLGACLDMYDVLRIDHFRGFESFYTIPFGSKNAMVGEWVKGPGIEFINAVKERFVGCEIIAEDLGFMTDAVKNLLHDSGFPGMKVLQFAFDTTESSDYLPHKYGKNSVVYTGTHDNTTLQAFLEETREKDLTFVKEYLKLSKEEGYIWGIIRGAMSSVANLAIVPMQDYLELPASCRMNEPSTLGGNWQWRISTELLTDKLAERILGITELYER